MYILERANSISFTDMCDACPSGISSMGLEGGILFFRKFLNHSTYISALIHPLSLLQKIVPATATSLNTFFFLRYTMHGGKTNPDAEN